jgi:unconventional prefoldin RPB5 interactor 1
LGREFSISSCLRLSFRHSDAPRVHKVLSHLRPVVDRSTNFNVSNMSTKVKDSFLDLERHRQLLEANIQKLRTSLEHWQTWEAEYEGLKEEIANLGPAPKAEQLIAVGKEYDGTLVTKSEVEDILGVGQQRTAQQVINVIDRRIDYVSKNVVTLWKQLDAMENKLAAASVISNPDIRDEESGLPITEIIEELDEEGNVISSRVESQGSSRAQLAEVLQKAGIKDISDLQQKVALASSEGGREAGVTSEPASPDPSPAADAPRQALEPKSAETEMAEPEPAETGETAALEETPALIRVTHQEEQESEDSYVVPEDESPEDAAIRREMLDYSMSEIGPIVAELNLEEEGDSAYEDEDYDYDDEDTSDLDDEDEFGRSKSSVINDELKERMRELQERLKSSEPGDRAMMNLGPGNADAIVDEKAKEEEQVKDDSPTNGILNANPPPVAKGAKSVRFAEDLDVSTAPVPTPAPAVKVAPAPSPLGDIVERSAPKQQSASAPTPAKKVSRFKSSRTSASTVEFPPEKDPAEDRKIIADTIVEKPVISAAPLEPDEFDQGLLQQEVTMEFHRMRNLAIRKQGGFLKDPSAPDEETGIIPNIEEEPGKKVSRFKAARMKI